MLTVNEKSPVIMIMVFTDELGAPLIPNTVHWRLDDITNDIEIVPWTLLASPASTMSVTIPGSNNTIEDESRTEEIHIFGVRVDDTLPGEAHAESEYIVKNLKGPTGP